MSTIIEHFDDLTDKGLKVIPLWSNSKVPMYKGWNQWWNRETIRNKLEQLPESNIGLLLGEVVDVEGDTDEANRQIADLIGTYPHPFYQSTKSVHHLFLNPDPELTHFRIGEIEFRGHGHQSVLPPSQHHGVVYRWLAKPDEPIPEMPRHLWVFYETKRRKRPLIKPGHLRAWCIECGDECYLHEKRFKLELRAFQLLGAKWQCQKCRRLDIRNACRMIRGGAPDEIVLINTLQLF